MAFEHSKGRADTAVKFMTWLTSAPGAPGVRDRHRRPAAARVGEQAARIPGVPEEVPRQQGVRARTSATSSTCGPTSRRTPRSRRPWARWSSRCCSARPSRRRHWTPRATRWRAYWRSVTAALLPATARRRRKPSVAQASRDQRAAWGMVAPSVLLIGLFGLVPVAWSVRAVLPAQRPADAGHLGGAEQLPRAGARPGLPRVDPAHRRLHGAVRADHAGQLAARRGGAEPPAARHLALPARRVRPGRHLDGGDRRHLQLAARPRLRHRQRGAGQARAPPARVLRLPRPRALHDGRDDDLGLDRVRRPDLPGRAPVDPAGPARGRPDRRLLDGPRRSG